MYGKKKNFNRISDDVVKENMVVVVLEAITNSLHSIKAIFPYFVYLHFGVILVKFACVEHYKSIKINLQLLYVF